MKKTILNLAVIAIVTVITFSCRKNDTTDINDTYDAIMRSQRSAKQIFTINVSTGGTITGAKGSRITFPPNFARNADGSAYTGEALITLQESLNKSTWMMDGLSASASNSMLESGGMINLAVNRNDNGQPLEPTLAMQTPTSPANLNSVIRAEVPRGNAQLDNLSLFLPDSNTTGNNPPANWRQAQQFPFVNNPTAYVFQIPKFSWINTDRFYTNPNPKTTITITPNLTGFAGSSQLQCMMVFKNISSVVRAYSSGANFIINNVPITTVADIVLVGKAADGKILFKVIKDNTNTLNQSINITPDISKGADVNAYLNSL